jgi:multiple sugar transport system permease protein
MLGQSTSDVRPDAPPTPLPPSLRKRNRLESSLFLAPALVWQLAWGWYPLVVAFAISFTEARIFGPSQWVGLENYSRMFPLSSSVDPLVLSSFRNTLVMAGLGIALTFFIPILISIFLLELPKKMQNLFLVLWFLPLSTLSNVILWRYFYDRDAGLLQQIFQGLGLPRMQFLEDPTLLGVQFWLLFPSLIFFGPALIYVATLQSVPTSYFEAAEIEGASFWRKIWTISIPRIRPILAMSMIFTIIATLQAYDWPFLMTGANNERTRTVVMYIVQNLIPFNQYGNGTALAMLLFFLIATIVVVFNRFYRSDPDR